ncbi:MAG: hypothetical protein GXP55_10815 [Deltaproteobacteria bacterium]|nr:hypothetical protein [Deltaproteobacteria bacterium]
MHAYNVEARGRTRSSEIRRLILALVVLSLAAGCGDDASPTDSGPIDAGSDASADAGPPGIDVARPECENLNPHYCTLPFPSSRYLDEDASTITGLRVAFPVEALPENQEGTAPVSLRPWNAFDGYSPLTPVMTYYGRALDTSSLVDELHIPDSLGDSSPTIWLDAQTGERVPHWAEVDAWEDTPVDEAALYMRPAIRLTPNHRYIVATRALQYADGEPVTASAYFAALRDGTTTEVAELEARRANFEDIFSKLEAAGVVRADLIEAWDFTTASDDSLIGDTLSMRDDALGRAGDRGIGCTVTRVDEDVNTEIWRRVRGTFTVPNYMTTQYEGSIAKRDADGAVTFNGLVEAPFEVDIPYSVRDAVLAGDGPRPGLMYGHGLLGTARQVGSGGTRVAEARLAMVGFGTDFWGLSESDSSYFVNEVMTQWGNFDAVGERLMQGAVNSVVLARSFRGVCADLDELKVDDAGTLKPLLSQTETYYYGISQGGIMGATVAALTPDIERFALQVGAVGYSHLMRRSMDFEDFENIFRLWYPTALDRHFLIASSQAAWDRTDPSSFVGHLLRDPLPGVGVKRIFYHTAHYDTQVSNSLSDVAARTMGIPFFSQSAYTPWEPASTTSGPSDSGYVIYELIGAASIPLGSQPPAMDNRVHDDLRFLEPVLMQIQTFLQPDGQVENFCPGDSCVIENVR